MAGKGFSHDIGEKYVELFEHLAMVGRRTKKATLEMMIATFDSVPDPLRYEILSRIPEESKRGLAAVRAALDEHVAARQQAARRRSGGPQSQSAKGA